MEFYYKIMYKPCNIPYFSKFQKKMQRKEIEKIRIVDSKNFLNLKFWKYEISKIDECI